MNGTSWHRQKDLEQLKERHQQETKGEFSLEKNFDGGGDRP